MKKLLQTAAISLAIGLVSGACQRPRTVESPVVIDTEGLLSADAVKIFRVEFSRAASQCLRAIDPTCSRVPQGTRNVCKAARFAAYKVCDSKQKSRLLRDQVAQAAQQSLGRKKPSGCGCKLKQHDQETPNDYGRRVAKAVFETCVEINPEPDSDITITSSVSAEFADIMTRRLDHDEDIRSCVLVTASQLGIKLFDSN